MARFGDLFTYASYESHFGAVSYYGVKLSKEWMGFPSGSEIFRVDTCIETGSVIFIDSNETEIMNGTF